MDGICPPEDDRQRHLAHPFFLAAAGQLTVFFNFSMECPSEFFD
jgi:hypothetical protein